MAEQAVYSVSSQISGWNRQIPLVTVQDKSILEADSSTGSCTCDNRRPSQPTRRSHTARSCSWGIVQSRRGWYAYGCSLAWHAPGNHVLDAPWWHWCLRPTACSKLNLDLKRTTWKRRRGVKTRILKKCLCNSAQPFSSVASQGPLSA